jgi:cell division protein FtsL
VYAVLVVSIIIVIAVLLLSLVTTTKAYDYQHTIDPLEKENDQDSKKEDDFHQK